MRMLSPAQWLFTSLLLVLAACDPPATETESDASCASAVYDVSWDGWGQGFFVTWCAPCHSAEVPDRFGAPEGVDFDTYAQVLRLADAVHDVVLVKQSMPPSGGLTDEDLVLFTELMRCEFGVGGDSGLD